MYYKNIPVHSYERGFFILLVVPGSRLAVNVSPESVELALTIAVCEGINVGAEKDLVFLSVLLCRVKSVPIVIGVVRVHTNENIGLCQLFNQLIGHIGGKNNVS